MDFFPAGSRAKPLASALEMSGNRKIFPGERESPRAARLAQLARAVCSPTSSSSFRLFSIDDGR
jgi:hypothetical protein